MKKLTREELKNVKGGLKTVPTGCYCYLGSVPPDPDCYFGVNPQLYCPAKYGLVCC
ncbi:bacteriocin-like protein [Mucilaginibacter xinganensis]|uniref:bacteriocin-like protein n=1 Tax=Mucilaginibacter xinganensis TaxID=1234841 RepID=UPI0012FE3854|nr:hypothetical protein [Mucilaginibacter xinganensis]